MGDTIIRGSAIDIRAVYGRLFGAASSPLKLRESVVSGHLYPSLSRDAYDSLAGMLPGRSILWKYLLLFSTPLEAAASQPPITMLRKSREKYVELVKFSLRAPDGSFEDWVEIPGFDAHAITSQTSTENLARNNPLSLEADSGWNDWFAAVDLRKTIRQDVERTFPDIPYFREQRVQSLLTTILYVHASLDPLVGYRQGMHELLAPLLYAVDFDSLDPTPSSPSDSPDQLAEVCDREWIAADAHSLFEAVMSKIGVWYEWQEPPKSLSIAGGQIDLKPYVAPIVSTCREIYDQYLKTCDPTLWSALQRSQIEPQIYGIRWLRLLFTREFPISQAMDLWDGLFALDPSLQLSKWICVAMLVRIRNDLIPSDYSGQLTHLLRYPSHVSLLTLGPSSSVSLLLAQAQTLQSAPNPASGVTVAMQNRDALGIPMEVPEPPPPPRRSRRDRDRDRDRRLQSPPTAAGLERRRSPQPGGVQAYANTLTSRIGSYAEQYRRDQFGLPELFSKGLSDINGVVSNTVSEIRRSLPELQSRTSSPEIAFPYQSVTRTTEERPPWEPRTRFEVEREISELQALNKKLGKGLGWAVDALLQSGESPEIENRKREAVECLAYVRDVLNTAKVPTDLDEERLFGEEELNRLRAERKEKEAARHKVEATASKEAAATLSLSASPSAPSPPLPTITGANRSQQYVPALDSPSVAGVSLSGPGHAKHASTPSTSLPPIRMPASLPFAPAPSSTPLPSSGSRGVGTSPSASGAAVPSRIAPWHSTHSSFEANNATTVLFRPPASLIEPPQALTAGGIVRRRTSNIGTEQLEAGASPVTYQSDPLRG